VAPGPPFATHIPDAPGLAQYVVLDDWQSPSPLHAVLHALLVAQMKPPGHPAADALVHVPVPSHIRWGVIMPEAHCESAQTVVAGYTSHAEPFARQSPSVAHEAAPWSVHDVAQQIEPPPVAVMHAPLVHCEPAVHDCPLPRSAHVVPWQSPLAQSADAPHVLPTPHVLLCPSHVLPPQSVSVSVPFFTPSVHVAAWHVRGDPVHTLSAQSPATVHDLPVPHLGHVAPPQSMSVSSASLTVSLQCAATQVPLPLQTVPPLSVHGVPWEAFVAPQVCEVHVRVAHTVPVAVQSLG
jgi:hypothetical protein